MYTAKEIMRMAISQAFLALLDYLNASPACASKQNESTDLIKDPEYAIDFTELALVSLQAPFSVQFLLNERAFCCFYCFCLIKEPPTLPTTESSQATDTMPD